MQQHIAKYLSIANPSGVANSPLAVWQFDGTADWYKDRTTNARDLSVVAGTFEWFFDPTGLTGLYFDAAEDHELIAPDSEIFRIAKDTTGAGDASLTVEMVVKQETTGGILFDCAASGETATTNILYRLKAETVDYNGLNEYAAGTDVTLNYTNAAIRLNELIYIALTVDSTGVVRNLYINGKLVDTKNANRAEKSTSGNTQRLRFGRPFDGSRAFKGSIFSIRITNETFDDGEILLAYQSLSAELSGLNTVTDKTGISDSCANLPVGGIGGVGVGADSGVKNSLISATGISDMSERLTLGGAAAYTDGLGAGEGSPANETKANNWVPKLGFRDSLQYEKSTTPTWNMATTDVNGRRHFLYSTAHKSFVYDATNDGWNNPTLNNFSGYARNGKKYTNGVEDTGPVYAPWYSEAASDYRGDRDEFPLRTLHVLTDMEWIIFDLDTFSGSAESLKLWMRFQLGAGTTEYLLGAANYTYLKDICFIDGVGYLVTANVSDTNKGRLCVVSFKATGQYVFYETSSGDDWIAASGKNITHRNATGALTTTGTPNILIQSESPYSVTAYKKNNKVYVAVGGEDYDPTLVTFIDEVASSSTEVKGLSLGDINVSSDRRKMAFDYRGWFWYSIEKTLYRSILDHEQGIIIAGTVGTKKYKIYDRYKGIVLPAYISHITFADNKVYVGTNDGIYIVDATNLSYHLGYSISGLGGRGCNNVGGSGEIIPGNNNSISGLNAFTVAFNDIPYTYLSVSTGFTINGSGCMTVIRVVDNEALISSVYPVLNERGSFFNAPLLPAPAL